MSYFESWMNVRGLSEADIERLKAGTFDYDINTPFLGEKEFMEKLYEHYEKGSVVTICPDYDADGIMAGTVFYAGLSELGFETVHCYFPTQFTGYGLTVESAQEILNQYPDTDVVVTCDNGIHADEAVEWFKREGIPVLVTDHHPSSSKPDSEACVDPSFAGDNYPFKGISGATVLWKILLRYAAEYKPECLERIRSLAVFAGISAVTDSMPMLEENRNLVRTAFQTVRSLWQASFFGEGFPDQMLEGYTDVSVRAFKGLYNLIKVSAENGGRPAEADEMFFGFTVGPILNSARRVDLSSEAAFNVFMGDGNPYVAAKHLWDLNQRRKDIVGPLSERAILNGEEELASGSIASLSSLSCVFCYGAEGCLGLITNALTSHTGMPSVCFGLFEENYRGEYEDAFVEENNNVLSGLTTEYVSGSARAPGWFDFYTFANWFSEANPGSIRFGGHGQAGAFTVAIEYLAEFSNALLWFANNIMESLPAAEAIIPFDLACGLGDGSFFEPGTLLLDDDRFKDWLEFSRSLDELKPFGEGFPKPVFRVSVDIATPGMEVRYMSGGKHLKCSLGKFDLILWNCGAAFSEEEPSLFFTDATLGINEFRGNQTITFYGNSYSTVDTVRFFDITVNDMFRNNKEVKNGHGCL